MKNKLNLISAIVCAVLAFGIMVTMIFTPFISVKVDSVDPALASAVARVAQDYPDKAVEYASWMAGAASDKGYTVSLSFFDAITSFGGTISLADLSSSMQKDEKSMGVEEAARTQKSIEDDIRALRNMSKKTFDMVLLFSSGAFRYGIAGTGNDALAEALKVFMIGFVLAAFVLCAITFVKSIITFIKCLVKMKKPDGEAAVNNTFLKYSRFSLITLVFVFFAFVPVGMVIPGAPAILILLLGLAYVVLQFLKGKNISYENPEIEASKNILSFTGIIFYCISCVLVIVYGIMASLPFSGEATGKAILKNGTDKGGLMAAAIAAQWIFGLLIIFIIATADDRAKFVTNTTFKGHYKKGYGKMIPDLYVAGEVIPSMVAGIVLFSFFLVAVILEIAAGLFETAAAATIIFMVFHIAYVALSIVYKQKLMKVAPTVCQNKVVMISGQQ